LPGQERAARGDHPRPQAMAQRRTAAAISEEQRRSRRAAGERRWPGRSAAAVEPVVDRAIEDAWLRKATAAASTAPRKMTEEGTVDPGVPGGAPSDRRG